MKLRKQRWFSLALLFPFLLSAVSLSIGAQSAEGSRAFGDKSLTASSATLASEQTDADEMRDATEVLERRDRTTKHFDLGNGYYRAVSYGGAVHRLDENGVWQDIDNRLQSSAEDPRQYTTSDGRVRISKDRPAVTLEENGYRIEMRLMTDAVGVTEIAAEQVPQVPVLSCDVSADLQKVRSAARYRDQLPSTDVEYILEGDDIKECIVVNSLSDRYVYQFDLTLNGLTPRLTDSGEIRLYRANGRAEEYSISAPYIYDAAGARSDAVHYELTEENGTYRVAVIANADWINAAERALPATVYLTITSEGFQDTHIASRTPNGNYGTQEALWISGSEIPFIKPYHVSVPYGSTVVDALLNVYYYYVDYVASGGLTAGAYQVMHDWDETGSNGLTWNIAQPDTSIYISDKCLDTQYFSGANGAYQSSPKLIRFDITDAARDWQDDPSLNYGIALRYLSGTNSSVSVWAHEAGNQYCASVTVNYKLDTERSCFIRNGHYNKYIQIDNDAAPNYDGDRDIIEQWSFDGDDDQLWIVSYLSDGYYKIKSAINGKLISVPPGEETNDDVSLVLLSEGSTVGDNQKWKIAKTTGGLYKIKAKSAMSYTAKDLVMRVNTKGLHTENGLNIMQMPYTEDADLVDEWRLIQKDRLPTPITLRGISASGHDHRTTLNYVSELITDAQYNNVTLNYGETTGTQFKNEMLASEVFVSHSHGDQVLRGSTVIGSKILLNDSSSTRNFLYSCTDETISTGSACLSATDDFSQVGLVVFVGCLTAAGGSSVDNLPVVAHRQGAEVAIGFSESINCAGAKEWIETFFKTLLDGYSVKVAVENAKQATENYLGTSSVVICGNEYYTLPA